ncbi:MAG TPA: hypothetical protein VGR05_04165 [Sphingomicrobium sp.]|nr:hypothetical protein [Sphingomicrobium sp.]
MKKFILTAAVASILPLSACATNPNYGYDDPYRSNNQGRNVATGAVGGAVLGGVAGAVIPGVSTVEGAIAGGIVGAVLGAVVNNRQYYRDTQGYCYYVDQYGRPIYDRNVRC